MTGKIHKTKHTGIIVVMITVAVICLGVFAACIYNEKQIEAANATFEESISDFPDSYKTYLRKLHKTYPNWNFVAYNTGIKFKTAVNNEYKDNKSLIENAYSKYLKANTLGNYDTSTGKYIAKDGSSWVSASKNCIAYFMDPRNFLDEEHIYMFEQLSYDSSTQTQVGVEAILQGSFMYNTEIGYINTSGKYKSSDTLYSEEIMTAAEKAQVSAYYLASKMLQEVGTSKNSTYAGMGASGSISGTYSSKYTGIYNFYNIGASSGSDPIANGLSWAGSGTTYNRPWNTPFKSIEGGALYIGETYINCGQNTIYYQRFNVNKNSTYSLYSHQYMTNIYGAAAEAANTSEAYTSLGITSLSKTFVIPVYKNMPGESTSITLGSSSDKTATISSSVNLRKGPSTEYSVVTTLDAGDTVTVKKGVMTDVSYGTRWLSNPYWYKITVAKGGASYTGYISAAYATLNKEINIVKGVKTQIQMSLGSDEVVYYRSEDPSIATVNSSGYVTGKKKGTTTIMAFTAGGNFSAVGIKVLKKGCTIDTTSVTLTIGSSKTLTVTVYPTNATDKSVTYTSSNSSVAKVTSSGKIKAKSAGTAVITVKAAVGGTSATCTVKVIPKKVKIKSIKSVSKGIKLKWETVSKASGYRIYRSTSLNGKYTKIKTVKSGTKTSYTDKSAAKNKTYYYKIRAYVTVSGKNVYGKYSKKVYTKRS